MLLNLKAEFVRKGLDPVTSVSSTLNCTDKTARNKLDGKTDFSVPEAISIVNRFFEKDRFEIAYLFSNVQQTRR